jgi:hypothetical protein
MGYLRAVFLRGEALTQLIAGIGERIIKEERFYVTSWCLKDIMETYLMKYLIDAENPHVATHAIS